jgi:hypothetical protein
VLLKSLISVCVFLIYLLSENGNQSGEIKQVDVIIKIPNLYLGENEQEFNNRSISDSFSIFYNTNFILYKFPYTFIEQHNDKIVNIEIRFTYFIYNYGSPYGYNYDPARPDSIKKLNVDSLISKKAFRVTDLFYDSGYQINETISKLHSFDLTEKYISIAKPTRNFPDSVIYNYSDLYMDLPISFSKKLEERKKLKILKIRGIYNSRFDDDYNTNLPRREFTFELKPHDVILDTFALYVFDLYHKIIRE